MNEKEINHHIQKSIITSLLSKDACRYSELKPKNVESNVFTYHLNQLIKTGIISKSNNLYSLTVNGKWLMDRVNLESLKLNLQPKIITILVVSNHQKELLMIKRKHQPYLNYVGFPSGKLHYGESLHDAANRELKEKANHSTDLSLTGNIIMRSYKAANLVNHIFGYVFTGSLDASGPQKSNNLFETYFGEEKFLYDDLSFKGHKEIIEAIKSHSNKNPFYLELDFESDF